MGDLNAADGSDTMLYLNEQQQLDSGEENPLEMNSSWKTFTEEQKSGIDWILYSPGIVNIIEAERVQDAPAANASDHFPVTATISVRNAPDTDGDGVANNIDRFPIDRNETVDVDNDGIGDNADTDNDNDGIPDSYELDNGLDPLLATDANLDPDDDGLTNLQEYTIGSLINNTDSDNDGMTDKDEFDQGRNPTVNEYHVLIILFNSMMD
jgi:hypothetical protein